MAIGKFTPPKQWADWVNLVLGIWLCVSPWVLKFDNDQTVTQYAFGFGVVLIFVECWTLSAFRAWEEWINVVLGAAMVLLPWVVAGVATVPKVNFVVVGLLVLVLALYEIWDVRRHSPHSA
jgi:hypothetical protein